MVWGTLGMNLRDHAALPADRDDRLLFWAVQGLLFGFICIGLLVFKAALLDGLVGPTAATQAVLVRLLTLVAVAALLATIYRHPVVRGLSGWRLLATAALACLLVTAVDAVVFPVMIGWLAPGCLAFVQQHPVPLAFQRILFCVVWSLAFYVLRHREAARHAVREAAAARLAATEAEVALRQSELERLAQQIEPHFLFNALSAVLACRHDPEAVESVTTALGDYLRFCLSRSGKPEPLGHELDAIEQLLSVHEARFAGELTCRVTTSPTARRVPVPPLLLGPLVDNALKFGGKTSASPRSIVVEAREAAGQLLIEVTNSGSWLVPSPERPGSGLANLRRRLEISGIEHRLDFVVRGGFVTARVTLPGTTRAMPPAANHPTGPRGSVP